MERLKAEAREAATLKGHRLGRFKQAVVTPDRKPGSGRPAAVAACAICGAMATVDPSPPPGEPEILGEAVARECFGIDRETHETA
jgi:hypothetical protein